MGSDETMRLGEGAIYIISEFPQDRPLELIIYKQFFFLYSHVGIPLTTKLYRVCVFEKKRKKKKKEGENGWKSERKTDRKFILMGSLKMVKKWVK